jgi:hypothetical protein
MENSGKTYIEFSIEGLLDVSNGEKDYILQELKTLLSDMFPPHLISRIQFHTSVITDADIAYAMYVSGAADRDIN